MKKFKDLERNVTFSEEYDENSFIGKWYDYEVWSDEEYWKLEKALIEIRETYPLPEDIPRETVLKIFRIMELMIVPNWLNFSIEPSLWVTDKITIYERYERLKQVVKSVFSGEKIEAGEIDFDYTNRQ